MTWLRDTFCDDPFYVYLVLALLAVVCLGAWHSRRQVRWLGMIALLAAAAGGTYLLDRLVVTDREAIGAALDEMRRAVAQRDAGALMEYLDEDYGGWKLTRKAVRVAVEAAMRAYETHAVKYSAAPRIEPHGDRADSTVYIVVHYGRPERPGRYPMGWQVEWIRRPAGWRVRRARQLDNPIP